MCIIRVFQNYQNCFKGILKFYWCMDLITATWAEGGLFLPLHELVFSVKLHFKSEQDLILEKALSPVSSGRLQVKKFWSKKNCCPKKFSGLKKILFQKNFWIWKKCGPKKMLGPKNYLCPIKILGLKINFVSKIKIFLFFLWHGSFLPLTQPKAHEESMSQISAF